MITRKNETYLVTFKSRDGIQSTFTVVARHGFWKEGGLPTCGTFIQELHGLGIRDGGKSKRLDCKQRVLSVCTIVQSREQCWVRFDLSDKGTGFDLGNKLTNLDH